MQKTNPYKILMVTIFMIVAHISMGQMSNYKSLYLYNFIKRIEWPATNSDQPFEILVYGDEETFLAIKQIAETKKAGDRSIEVFYSERVEEFKLVDLIYVDYSNRKSIPELISWIANQSILLVSDYKNAELTDINLIETSDGIDFIIRPDIIRDKELKLSDMLIQLGKPEYKNQ